jgi:hypothetical protein
MLIIKAFLGPPKRQIRGYNDSQQTYLMPHFFRTKPDSDLFLFCTNSRKKMLIVRAHQL